MHAIQMIHRDLHAENVLILTDATGQVSTGPGAVKIIDVGLAKIYDFLAPSTMSVAGVGPAWYFSPERRRGEAFNHLDDVWAAGCMMAEMVIGQGRYIQKHPGHGPGGIDFSLSSVALATLLRHCEGSTLAPAVALALAPRVELRGSAQQLLELMTLDSEKKVLKPACIPGRSFVELYLPQEVHLVVSHSWLEPLEDLLLALQRHAGHAQCQGLAKMIQPQRPWGYWLSLLSSGPAEVPEGQMASAMETAQQFLIDAGTRWAGGDVPAEDHQRKLGSNLPSYERLE
eukprot:s3152_g8.t1